MKKYFAAFAAVILGCIGARGAQPEVVLVESASSPIVSFRLIFMTGAAYDPPGKEGVASLTAAMLAKGGSRALSYEEIVRALYPMAASFDWQVDKEMTAFVGATHVDTLEKYYGLVHQMLLEPGFREEDFTRLKADAINFLKISLRDSNDEELAKEELYSRIYTGHPYGHESMGGVSSLEKLTLQDVRDFYRNNYTSGNMTIGLAGHPPAALQEKIKTDFAALPGTGFRTNRFDAPKALARSQVEIITRETRSTAISFGFPIHARRGDKDWPALAVVSSYLGQHRSSNSHLYQRLREARGLNYGDYAYIEYFPRGMFQFEPDPNLARQQQIFQIWIRPVPPNNAVFAYRGALYEFDKLVRDGMSKEDFESTREFLSKYVSVLMSTQDARLGYILDSRYYHTPDFDQYLPAALQKLTLKDVNAAIKKHLAGKPIETVMVTKDGEQLRKALASGERSPITYNSPKPKDILEEDKLIEKFPLKLKAEDIKIVPAEQVFQ